MLTLLTSKVESSSQNGSSCQRSNCWDLHSENASLWPEKKRGTTSQERPSNNGERLNFGNMWCFTSFKAFFFHEQIDDSPPRCVGGRWSASPATDRSTFDPYSLTQRGLFQEVVKPCTKNNYMVKLLHFESSLRRILAE